MKTTVELSDELFRRAKSIAAMLGMTLKEFFAGATEREIRRLQTQQTDHPGPSWHRLLQRPTPGGHFDRVEGIERVSWRSEPQG